MCIHHRFFRLFSFGCILGSPVLGLSQNSTNVVLSTGTNQAISVSTSSRPGVSIRPSARTYGYSTPEMFLRAVRNPTIFPIKDSTLQLENLVGNIDIILPRRDHPPIGLGLYPTPENAGIFSISKRIDSDASPLGSLVPILQIQPSAFGEDALTLRGRFQLQDSATGQITTLIDAAGIDTASVITDSLLITDSVTGIPVSLTIANGTLQAAVSQSADPLKGDGAVVLGGQRNRATGRGSVVLGGFNYADQSNVASGTGSVIIGAKASVVNSGLSAIVGGQGSQILGTGSDYSSIIGGGGNVMSAAAGNYNTIVGGFNNQFLIGGFASAIIAGGGNQILDGAYFQAIVGAEGSSIGRSRASVILGGSMSRIAGNTAVNEGRNLVGGGSYNEIQAAAYTSAILGGMGNVITTGWNNAIIAGKYATNSGTSSLVTGEGTVADGTAQLVAGRYNAPVTNGALIIGGGSNAGQRTNAFSVDFSGNVQAKGTMRAGAILLTAPQGNISMGAFTDD